MLDETTIRSQLACPDVKVRVHLQGGTAVHARAADTTYTMTVALSIYPEGHSWDVPKWVALINERVTLAVPVIAVPLVPSPVLVIGIIVAAAAIEVRDKEKGKRGVRGDSIAIQQVQ